MKAACWYGTQKVQVEQVPEPKILNPRDAIVKLSLTSSTVEKDLNGRDIEQVLRSRPALLRHPDLSRGGVVRAPLLLVERYK